MGKQEIMGKIFIETITPKKVWNKNYIFGLFLKLQKTDFRRLHYEVYIVLNNTVSSLDYTILGTYQIF